MGRVVDSRASQAPPALPASRCAGPALTPLTASCCPPHRALATQPQRPGPRPRRARGPSGLGQVPVRERAAGAEPPTRAALGAPSFISVSSFLPVASVAPPRTLLFFCAFPARAARLPSSPPMRGAGCTPRFTIARRPTPPPTARATQ